MSYLTAKQFSKIWQISERRIIKLCSEDRISGAVKNGMIWLIPEDTIKPSDKRNKISKYINTQKRVMIVNFCNEIGLELSLILKKEGYIVDGISNKKEIIANKEFSNIKKYEVNLNDKKSILEILEETEKYYDGLIYINYNNEPEKYKEAYIKEFANKMNDESSIILINNINYKNKKLEQKLQSELKNKIGVRINALILKVPENKKYIINYKDLAEDVTAMFTKFKNMTGMTIYANEGIIEFEENGRTLPLSVGKYYKAITNYFKRMEKEDYIWSPSIMQEDEWTDSPLEMNFRVTNIDTANRGTKMERIFIFSKSRIKEFKNNKTLQIFMQSNINTMFVDYDEILAKESELLKIVKDGFIGINKDTLIVDLPCNGEERGYISINKAEIDKAWKCYKRLKNYAVDLKEVLK